jgi:acyl carrier protein
MTCNDSIVDIEDKLVSFICSNFLVEPDEIDREESLVDQGVIDSFGLIEITAFIERTFGLTVDEADMTRQSFGSVRKMSSFVSGKLGS